MAKKKVAKKATKKVAKKAVKKAAPKKITGVKTRFTKTQLLTELSEKTELTKKQVASVIDELAVVMNRHIKKGAVGEFVLPGLLKVKTVKKPATKARKGINPFTGEEQMFKAKPASTRVKILPLKKLKEMAL